MYVHWMNDEMKDEERKWNVTARPQYFRVC
jgi:hypothetical protein